MGRKKGSIEEALKRVFYSGHRDKYVVYVLNRTPLGVGVKPIHVKDIDDIRGGYIYVKNDVIPYHRVVEIRDINGNIIFARKKTSG
ncbi:DUF504 domain-containing protein [Thermogladius sp. 4427co]|uniref:DUF504 domain-containing protein n=1 Tax=Thermogladius sp. 4427co TaxID=3450718 RepID=UPI003F795B36